MGRAAMRTVVATVVTGTLIALAGCGSSSKPAYCSDRTNLENSIKNLPTVTSSSGVSGLKSQITTIESDANSVVNSAKSDFPSQTSAVKTSVDALQSAVNALPVEPFSQSDRRDRTRRQKRCELGQELLGRQQVEVQLTRQSATAGRSACRLVAWLLVRCRRSLTRWSRSGTTSAIRTAGKQSDDVCPRPGGTCALMCFRWWSRAARRRSRGRR